MKKPFVSLVSAVMLAVALSSNAAYAGIQLSSTRVVMNEANRNGSVFAKNIEGAPVVVQTWIEGNGEQMETPFFITPPLSRFDPGTERSLNIARVGQDLPGDRETYYWINVLEIPQKTQEDQNSLTFATRTRIKLFYRPTAIQDLPRGPEQLQWKVQADGKKCKLAIENASAYTVNFASMEGGTFGKGFGVGVVALPLATTLVDMASCPAAGAKLTPQVVNDYGAIVDWPVVTLPAASR